MARHFSSTLAIAGLLAAAFSTAARADEGYVLGHTDLVPGITLEWTAQSTGKLHLKIQASGKETILDPETSAERKGRFTAISPTEATFEVTDSTDVPVRPGGGGLKGTQLVFKKEDGDWTIAKKDGSKLSAAEENDLRGVNPIALADMEALVFGDQPRKPGDHWKVDASKLKQLASLEHPTGTIEAEFVDLAKSGEIDCATIKLHLDIEGTAPSGLKGHVKADTVEHRSLADKFLVDGKTEGTLEMSGKTSSDAEIEGSGTITTILSNIIHHS